MKAVESNRCNELPIPEDTAMRSYSAETDRIVNTTAMQDDLEILQRETFDYFIHEANPANGLIRDKTEAD